MATAHDRARSAPSDRVRVRRVNDRAAYDRETIDAVLDAGLIAHLGFVDDGQPYVIPTLHARVGDDLYVHGSSAARSLRTLERGVPVCVTVTIVDGIVLARSVFEHSMNYRSVVLLGTATAVASSEEKNEALRAFTEKLLPGRWEDARQPTELELKATSVLRVPIDEASAKVRDGGPDDEPAEDLALDVWAGHIPLAIASQAPVPAEDLRDGIPVPSYAAAYRRPGLTS
jgi:nitroimidazol reductase NimA-like FMN-containing flavoprotein (pyridoxamine 5'-phosphate oxidase superfamily)